MFERFNEHVRRSLFFARYEASRSNSRSIATQHVLLGMLREADPAFIRLLGERGIDARELREELLGDRVALDRVSTSPDLPLAEESKKALAFAVHEAENMGHAGVDSEHLVLGLLSGALISSSCVRRSSAAVASSRPRLPLRRLPTSPSTRATSR
jgi:ATP-dependent Clp protease ATP-binding subunit ClpC